MADDKQSMLLAQLAAKDQELMKLKEELEALKAQRPPAPEQQPPPPPPQQPQQQPPAPVCAPREVPPSMAGLSPVKKKPQLSHVPYECITTKSPDGRDEWPTVSRVKPPPEFADKFADMVKVGCYYWRIVDKVVVSTKSKSGS
ncbi:hypothetical protein DIPPA_25702 [Diplonema papillatum]|nr:hypothetical protein DIPPA_25702 [Diplonema papillatum]